MVRTPPSSSEADIESFSQLCDQLAGFGADLTPEYADGFLTAVVACRRLILPSEWLPALAGDAFERAFGDPDAVNQAMAVLLARYNVVAGQLNPEALMEWPDDLRLEPLMVSYTDEDRTQALADGVATAEQVEQVMHTGVAWAAGFFGAVSAFPDDWPEPPDELTDADESMYAQCLQQVELLALAPAELPEAAKALYPDELPTRDQLIDDACFAVQDLRLHGLDHAPRPVTVHAGPKTGRNETCPCGSGKKFKKCHGS